MIRRIRFGSQGRPMLGLVLFLLLAAMVIGGWRVFARQSGGIPLSLGGGRYEVRVVSTEADRARGLSGTASLPKGEGMLFVYGEDGLWGIWMKDMKYPIDILWLDQSKAVVDLVRNASPASYPSTVYRPNKPSRYVLELPGGSAHEAGITIGSRATFDVERADGMKS